MTNIVAQMYANIHRSSNRLLQLLAHASISILVWIAKHDCLKKQLLATPTDGLQF